jgi:hypothetical protein
MFTFSSRRVAGIFLVLAAVGIEIQIVGGADYPTVPPGLIILLVAAIIMFFVRPVWAVAVAAVATVFISVGGVVAPNLREQLGDAGMTLVFAGSVVQVIGLLGALAMLVPALRQAAAQRRSAKQLQG